MRKIFLWVFLIVFAVGVGTLGALTFRSIGSQAYIGSPNNDSSYQQPYDSQNQNDFRQYIDRFSRGELNQQDQQYMYDMMQRYCGSNFSDNQYEGERLNGGVFWGFAFGFTLVLLWILLIAWIVTFIGRIFSRKE